MMVGGQVKNHSVATWILLTALVKSRTICLVLFMNTLHFLISFLIYGLIEKMVFINTFWLYFYDKFLMMIELSQNLYYQ